MLKSLVLLFSLGQTSFSLASNQDIQSQNEKFQNQNPLMSAVNHGHCAFAVHHENSLVPAFLYVSVDQLFDNLECEKRNHCFGKKNGKSLEFWIQNLYEPRYT